MPPRPLNLLTTDGGKTADASWQPLPEWSATLLMRLRNGQRVLVDGNRGTVSLVDA